MYEFDKGIALVAGGSGGIGAAIVRRLVDAGSDVAFTWYRNEDAARALCDELAGRAHSMQLSLEDGVAVNRVFEETIQRSGQIHSVIYASGPKVPVNFVGGLSADDWKQTFEHDTHACFNLVNAALPVLKAQQYGSITAVTTTQYARHVPMSVLSSAPKAAVESLLQVAAKEYGRFGVRANAVRSGWLAGGSFADGIGGQLDQKAIDAITAQVPLRELGTPDDVANAVVFLCSKQARYITGDALTVDGGWKL